MAIKMQATKPLPHLGADVGELYDVPDEDAVRRHEYAGRGVRYEAPKEAKPAGKAPSKTKPAGPRETKPETPALQKVQTSPGWYDVVDESGKAINEKSLRSAEADALIAEATDA